MIIFLKIFGGLILLFVGGDVLVRGAVSLAKSLKLSSFIIGLTVVAYGTSSPELAISLKSALNGYADISLGNVIGSNISNILCVLGLTAIIYPVAIDKKLSLIDSIFMIFVTGLLIAACLFEKINFISGLIFLLVLVTYTIIVFRKAKKSKDTLQKEQTEDKSGVKLNTLFSLVFCIAGATLLAYGGDTLIDGATELAKLFGWSEATIGVTIIAFGGSSPELITSAIAAFRRKSEIVFGNIIGSNLFNILGILGITGIVAPIEVNKDFLYFDLPALMIITVILSLMINYLPKINRLTGGVFFLLYIGYIAYQF